MAEELGQILVLVGGGHQGDDPEGRVEPDPAEVPCPVHGRERLDGLGVGTENVDGGPEGPGVHRGRVVHGGRLSFLRGRGDLRVGGGRSV